ncbi:MAG: hypothetical protein ACRCXT_21160 [Paraclostridium sp.]
MKIKAIIKNKGTLELESKDNRKYEDIIINLKDVLYVCERKRKIVDGTEEVIGTIKLSDNNLILMDIADKNKLYDDIKYIQNSMLTIDLSFIYMNDIVDNYNYIVRRNMITSISETKYSDTLGEDVSTIKLSSFGLVNSIKVTPNEKDYIISQIKNIDTVRDINECFGLTKITLAVNELLKYMGNVITYSAKNKIDTTKIDVFKRIYRFTNTLLYNGSKNGDFNNACICIVHELQKSMMELNSVLTREKYSADLEIIQELFDSILNGKYYLYSLSSMIDVAFGSTNIKRLVKCLIELKYFSNKYSNVNVNETTDNGEECNMRSLLINKGIREFNTIVTDKETHLYIELISNTSLYNQCHKHLYEYDVILNHMNSIVKR